MQKTAAGGVRHDLGVVAAKNLATLSEARRAAAELLLADAAIAHTMLDLVETRDRGRAQVSLSRARDALDTINLYGSKLGFDGEQRRAIEEASDSLQLRVAAVERELA